MTDCSVCIIVILVLVISHFLGGGGGWGGGVGGAILLFSYLVIFCSFSTKDSKYLLKQRTIN